RGGSPSPGAARRPLPASGARSKPSTTISNNIRRGVMVWTAPYGISCARMRLLQISDKGAVRGPDYPHWNGYVEAFFSAAWGGCRRAAGFAQEVAAQRGIGVFCQAAADRDRNGGVRRGPLLGAGVAQTRPRGEADG